MTPEKKTPLSERIAAALRAPLQAEELEILNESDRHAGHAGDDGSGESHFRIFIVSPLFAGKSRIERHRMVNALLDSTLPVRPHAVSLKTLSPAERHGNREA